MVSKQQQLEWLANKYKTWRGQGAEYLCLSTTELGKFAVVNSHVITRKEWQQERDKMQQKCNESECGVMTLDEAIDHANEKSSELEGVCAENHRLLAHWLTKYRDTLSKDNKPAPDSSWYDRGEFPPVGCKCEMIDDRYDWVECDVIAHKDSFCIAWVDSRMSPFYTNDLNEFRPLRTEREKAIEEITSYFCDADGCQVTPCVADIISARLYNAGYRKLKS